MRIVQSPSPNHEPRPEGTTVDILLLHYTGMRTGAEALARLCDPEARVSAHYLIEVGGSIFQLVPEERRAWHAGVAAWAGTTDINDRSIGIELVNPGHEFGYRAFPEAQMAALVELAGGILKRWPIPPHRVLGHSDVAPARKQDPGELFDWPRLARQGIGIWPAPDGDPVPAALPIGEVQDLLARFGYAVPFTGEDDPDTRLVVAAFQRHFRPARVDGTCDAETVRLLRGLCAMLT